MNTTMTDETSETLATLRDYIERSTHWQEGGADRHAALLSLRALDDELERLRIQVDALTRDKRELLRVE